MLAGGYSWRLFFYVVLAFAAALFIAAFFLVEETSYKRPDPAISPSPSRVDEKYGEDIPRTTLSPPSRRSLISTLKPWSSIDHEAQFFTTMFRSFTYFFVPAVFWVVATFGRFFSVDGAGSC